MVAFISTGNGSECEELMVAFMPAGGGGELTSAGDGSEGEELMVAFMPAGGGGELTCRPDTGDCGGVIGPDGRVLMDGGDATDGDKGAGREGRGSGTENGMGGGDGDSDAELRLK